MKLNRCAVIEEEDLRIVEMDFYPEETDLLRESSDTAPFLSFRVKINHKGYPRPPEAHLEALQHVRGVISAEIQRLEALIDAKR